MRVSSLLVDQVFTLDEWYHDRMNNNDNNHFQNVLCFVIRYKSEQNIILQCIIVTCCELCRQRMLVGLPR